MATFTEDFTRMRHESDQLRRNRDQARQERQEFVQNVRAEVGQLREGVKQMRDGFRDGLAEMAEEVRGDLAACRALLADFGADLRTGAAIFRRRHR